MRLTIHGARWFGDKAIGKLAGKLWARGFTFDYISDRQLAGATAVNGRALSCPAAIIAPWSCPRAITCRWRRWRSYSRWPRQARR